MDKRKAVFGMISGKFHQSIEMKNFSWLVIGKVIQMILSLIVGILTARYLGPSNYGLINYANTYISFFAAICTLGIPAILVKNFTDKPNECGITLGTTLLMRCASSLLSGILIIFIVGIVDHGETLTLTVVSIVCLSLIFQPFESFNYWFQYRYKAKVTAIVSLVAYVAVTIYRVILLIQGKSIEWFAVALALDYFVVAVALLFCYKKHNGPSLSISVSKGKELLGSSYHFILSSLMVAIYGYTDKIMLKQMLDETSVGYYSTATAVCTMWVFVLQAVVDAMYPTIMKLFKMDHNAYERKNKQLYALVFYIAIGVSIVISIFAAFGIQLLYGDAYLPATNPLRIVTWYTAFSYLGVARNAWLVCEGKQKYLKYMYAIAAVLNVVLNSIFIPMWGASGAAFASLITQIFTSLLLPAMIKELRPNARLMIDGILLRGIR